MSTSSEKESSVSAAEDPTNAPADADPFALPSDDVEDLVAFIQALKRMRPEENSQQGAEQHFKKVGKAMAAASETILAGKPTGDHLHTAVQSRLLGLTLLERFGDESAGKKVAQFVRKMEQDERPAVVQIIENYQLQRRASDWPGMDDREKTVYAKSLVGFVRKWPVSNENLRMAHELGQLMERSGDVQLAAKVYQGLALVLGQNENPNIAALADNFAGTARRLGLLGNTMEIKGELLDGNPIDWSAYKGKVVLVDFWATWCDPCVREIPNVKKNFEAYHEKGFEVVGISLDDDRQTLEAFVDEQRIPWPILHHTEGQNHPMATYYGISAIPTAILIDQQGKVVSMNARSDGEGVDLLGQHLEKLLGPPDSAP